MKAIKYIVLIAIMLSNATHADPYDNMPQIPLPQKRISDYTAQDIVGCVFGRNMAQPKEHPLRVKNPGAKLKAEWPGSKVAANVDTIIGYILLSDSPKFDERISDGIYWILWHVMDVPKSDIADAFARVYAAQTDQVAKRKVAFLGRYLFPWLADERVLVPLRDMLDDSTVYENKKVNEGGWRYIATVRREASHCLIGYIYDDSLLHMGMPENQHLMSAAELAALKIGDDRTKEPTMCQALKAWYTTHWTEVTAKCAEVRLKPDSERRFTGPTSYRVLLDPLTPESNR